MVEKPVQQCKNSIQLKIKIVEAQAPPRFRTRRCLPATDSKTLSRRLLAMDSKTGADIRALRAALRASRAALRAAGPSLVGQLQQELLDMV